MIKITDTQNDIIHIIWLFIIIISLPFIIQSAKAYDIPDNPYTNLTEQSTLITNFSDLNFYVNNTDYLNSISVYSNINTKDERITYKRVHKFYDTSGNVLKIQFEYIVYHNFYGISFTVLRTTTISFNDVIIQPEEKIITSEDNIIPISFFMIPLTYKINEEIQFTNFNVVVIKISRYFINKETKYTLPKSFNIDNFRLADSFTDLTYDSMYVNTIDRTNDLFRLKLDVESKYTSLNIVFKLIFDFFKGIMSVIRWFGGSQSEYDFYQMQDNLLLPLTIVNVFINVIYMIARTIFVMGIIWTFSFVECLILIYAYISDKNKDIVNTLTKFFEMSISFWTIVIINPSKWLFEKVAKFWS